MDTGDDYRIVPISLFALNLRKNFQLPLKIPSASAIHLCATLPLASFYSSILNSFQFDLFSFVILLYTLDIYMLLKPFLEQRWVTLLSAACNHDF